MSNVFELLVLSSFKCFGFGFVFFKTPFKMLCLNIQSVKPSHSKLTAFCTNINRASVPFEMIPEKGFFVLFCFYQNRVLFFTIGLAKVIYNRKEAG